MSIWDGWPGWPVGTWPEAPWEAVPDLVARYREAAGNPALPTAPDGAGHVNTGGDNFAATYAAARAGWQDWPGWPLGRWPGLAWGWQPA